MKSTKYRILFVFVSLILIYCAASVLAAPYYRLLENERIKFLGFKAIDSVVANQYLNMGSTKERAAFYEDYWSGRDEERTVFEERSADAFRQFGRVAPVSDDRIQVYVKYGEARREVITPEKKVGVSSSVVVHPAEIWIYKSEGLIFDFVRMARAYELISQSDFGDRVVIPHLQEIASDTTMNIEVEESLDFALSYGRFRQQRNLTRLELYVNVQIEDTTGSSFFRDIKVYGRDDSLVSHTRHILIPKGGATGVFADESNLWLKPEEYRVEVKLVDIKNRRRGYEELPVNLIEYQDDAKEISDLIPARLIDMSFTHEKFDKPVGRVIPMLQRVLPLHRLFYLYSEAYNLETKDGMHRVRTTYEVYNKEQMRQEVVDVMIKDWIESGNVAYLGTEYHPMDLSPGSYIIVLKVKDLISGKERSAVSEFRLVATDW